MLEFLMRIFIALAGIILSMLGLITTTIFFYIGIRLGMDTGQMLIDMMLGV